MSPDGERILSGAADGTVRVWDVATGQEKLTLTIAALKAYPTQRIGCLAMSEDGQLIIAAGIDGMVSVWEAPLPRAEPSKRK